MKNHTKRLLALILCVAMLLPMFPDTVLAAVSVPSGMMAVEAENRLYAVWNTFSNVEGNGSRTDCSGGSMVGSGSHGQNIAFADIDQDADLSKTAYVKWLVEAPADGNYSLSLRYLLKTTSISNNQSFTSVPYATFLINGETAYKANYQGKNNWVSNTDSVSVSLKKGVNEIIAIPLVQDVIQALGGSCWANVDCLYIQNTLTGVKNTVEAENTDYAVWNSYNATESNTNASGGVQVGGANTDNNVHFSDLQSGVDLSDTAYVKWTVDAPAAGNYDIAARAHIRISGSHSGKLSEKVYVTFFVNGQTPYKAAFDGENNWVYDTQTVSVALNEGKNEIIAIPLVRDIFEDQSLTWAWANMDCLYMDARLTAVENEKMPAMQTVEADNTLYATWNTYTKAESNANASGGVIVGGGTQSGNIAYGDLTEDADLSETAYVKWTVHAPEAGAYYIGLRYHPYANKYGNNKDMEPKAYAAFFINGKDAYQAEFNGKSNWVYDTQMIQVNLAAGNNEIIAIPLVKELVDAYEGGWANVDCLYIQEGLTPVMNRLEAEDTVYAVWNSFYATENRTDASGGMIVGNGKHGKNISYAELNADADLSDTAYVKWYVEAPADGEYAVALRYLMKANGLSNNTVLDPQAYAVFFVNGETPYKAGFTGKNGWVSDTQSVMLTLKEGLNEIVAIPLVKDVITALGDSWANVDCLYLDTRLTPRIPEAPATLKPVEAEDTLYAKWNNYSTVEGPRNDANAGGYLVGGGNLDSNVLYSQLTEGVDLSGTAYVQWTVAAPEDGQYAIGLRYLMNAKPLPTGEELDSGAYCTFFINGKDVYRADFTGKDNWVSDTETVEVTLKKGENQIVAIPFIKDLIDSYGTQDPGYANVDCLYIEDTLTAVPAVKLEAEDTANAGWNKYTALEHAAAGGYTLVSGDSTQNVTFDALSAGVDLTDTAYVQWTLNAPADGEYVVALRYLLAAESDATDAYAAFFVNGQTAYKAGFSGQNNGIGNTEAVKLTLKKGDNTVIVIPMTGEQYAAWGGTAKMDCLYIDSRLSVGKNRLEAENSVYTAWNVYNKMENNSNASAGTVVGGGDASKNVYYADLAAGVKLGNTSYVKWAVEAPADGKYRVALRYSVKADKKDNDTRLSPGAYAAFFVNGETAYKAQFLGKNNWVYDTETITVSLKAGTNEIIAIPMVKDLYDAWGGGWANVDCVYLDGKLTVLRAPQILPDKITVEAEDQSKTTWNIYSTTESNNNASGKMVVGGSDASKNVYYADLAAGVKLGNTAYVKWAVEAPADGEYEVALRYQVKAGNQDNNTELDPAAYAVFFVNGKTPYKAQFQGLNNWTYDTQTITVSLKKGSNEIIAIPLIHDLVESYSWGYANVDCVYLDGKLTVLDAPEIPADDRPDPDPHKIEAEDQSKTAWNIYSTTENNNDASGKMVVGGSDASKNVYYADLVPGVKLGNTAYVKWAVEAPAAGEYTIALRYLVKAGNQDNNTELDPAAYAVFFVNGKDAYKATFNGKNNWTYDTQTITVTLKKGVNEIVAIPLIRDLVESYSWGYANVDCVYLDGKLTVLDAPALPEDDMPPPEILQVEAEDTVYTVWNSYSTVQEHNSAQGGKLAAGSAANKNVYYNELVPGVDLSRTAYVQWTFVALEEGDYKFSLRYNPKADGIAVGEELEPAGYAAFFVNGEAAYQAEFLGKNNWVYDTKTVKLHLQKGENTVIAIPMVKDLYDAWGGGWANVDCLYYDGKLTVQKAPAKKTVEAEDRSLTYWNGYLNQEAHNSASGGYQAAGSSAQNNVYFSQLKKGVDLTYTSYVKWVISAPEAGNYTFTLRYAPKASNAKDGKEIDPGAYAAFFVNGETAYQAQFLGYNNWVYNTKQITIHLEKGDNELIVIPMVKDLYDAWGGGWANVDCLYMDEVLSVKPTGYVEQNRTTVEAEDTTYTQWNIYNTTENHSSASGKLVAAGSDAAANLYLKDLKKGADLSGTAFLKWTVIAPEAGNYTFSLRYAAKEDGVASGDQYEKANAYATFFVNGESYKAALTGFGARCNWLWDTENVSIYLEKGENELYCIPLIKDLYDAWGGGWANVDCLYMEPSLSLKKQPVYTRFEAENSEFNLYEGFATRVGTEDWNSAYENDVTFDNLNEETIVAVSHVKYYVFAEKAGTYRIGFGFRQGHNKMEYLDAFFGLSVNLESYYKVPFTATNAGNNRLVYFDVELKEGDNYLYCTACLKDLMDYPQYPSQKNGYVLWIDHDYILLSEGLTSVVASALPNWTGDQDADYNQSLLSVWGDLTPPENQPEETQPQVPTEPAAPEKPDNGLVWAGILSGIAVLALLLIFLLAKKKKKEKA